MVDRSPTDTGAAMRRIDYDTEQYQDYARGRALTEQQLQAWISAFGALLPERRPLAGLDVGSGTGRLRRGHPSAVRQRRLRSHVLVLAPRPGQAPGRPGAGQGAEARRAAATARELLR